ncbi:non-ribosomal peptide synthetase [Streptomyces sp. NPDC012461]|uniref:Amino acid adenylation domain-containing protein n=2 Tax=unclassified Streptomyces TaxID=2593676 RepID=A0A6G3R1H4_9ACTN|nr:MULTISPECIES: non-ribosomal peptide synthetase [unclassified Streptomyces]NEA89442.1 amino acid adenylation domain-containing protein [Streptomyces sp. SID14436]NEC81664.1 amino acid adenylation domain-containing protein [Streptomyces sp. SID7958]
MVLRKASDLVSSRETDQVHLQFSERARQTPDAPAIECDETVLTYGELDRSSDILATELRRAGVAAEDRVAVCIEPSLGLIVAQLAILKAGAAFVPINPDYPDERLRYLVADSAAVAVVSESRFAQRLPDGPVTVLLDADGPGEYAPLPAVQVHPNSAACVIYTSGSTGDPKGVVITHRGLVHLARCAADRFSLRYGDRFLQMAAISFSAFLEEVYPSLLTGATVLLAGRRRVLTSTRTLLEVLQRRQVTGFGITTALWHGVVEDMAADGDRFPDCVRFVLMGGEAARPGAVQQWVTLGMPLVHVYGPTEATATATYLHTDDYTPGADGDWTLPIGRVIPATQVYLLDEQMRMVADGAPGELYVGGLPVARGYLGRPAMTAERFLPDPYGEAGARMYRTGDVARLRADGNLEFLGRADDQLKVNGYRIEPAEVEAVIERHPDVSQACVVALQDGSGGSRLTAYVVARADGPDDLDLIGIRNHVMALLPEFTVPGSWAAVDELPLTLNGKVDRTALSRQPLPPTAKGRVVPADPVEQAVADIWSAVLGVPQISVTDDFFDLGGDSLKVARVISRTRRMLEVELPHRAVFDNRTVREVASIVRTLVDDQPAPGRQPEQAEATTRRRRELMSRALHKRTGLPGASPLSAAQRGLWFMNELLDESPVYNAPWWCRFHGRLDMVAFRSALNAVVRRHDILRSRFLTVDGTPIQVVEPDGDVGWEIVDLTELPAKDREAAAFAAAGTEAASWIDVRTQVMRVRLLRLTEDDHLLVVNAHHLVFDGASAEVFLEDLSANYNSIVRGDEPAMPDLPLQYADFAMWQGEHLRGRELEQLLDFWRPKLADSPPLVLPQDREGTAHADRPADTTRTMLPTAARDRIDQLAPDASVTRFMALFTIFLIVLHRRCGQDDMSVGTPVSHRPLPHHEHLIGYFVNTLVLRCDLSGDPSFRELLDRVRTVCVNAYNHQELPLDVLVEHLGRQSAPQVRATFSVDRGPGSDARFAELEVEPGHELPSGRAKFDLVWLVEEKGTDLYVSVDYDRDRFDATTIQELIDDFTELLHAAAAQPDQRLSRLGRSEPASVPTLQELTRQLCGMFALAFGLDEVAPDDDFFELGGYSALAAQLAARIRERYAVELTLRAFFDEPTVAGIASKIHGSAVVDMQQTENNDTETLEDLLHEIENLSDDEINAVLDGDQ